MLSVAELKTYDRWIDRPASEVLASVIVHGGWAKIFPMSEPFPLWASRVRNYFNLRPARLKLLNLWAGRIAMKRQSIGLASRIGKGLTATFAFSDNVYQDERGQYWFEMHPGSTPYHTPGKVTGGKKVRAALTPQKMTDVFKLISPDATGGSLEVCVHNFGAGLFGGKRQIGEIGKWVNVRTKIVIDEIYKGSYNYSDTTVMGYDAHEYRDMKPHRDHSGFYVDPRPGGAPLGERRFPRYDRQGRPIG
jgi:hypothetical protein